MNSILGIDIGGANLKYASDAGKTFSRDFPLWRLPGELAETLARDISAFPQHSRLAVTMTGELADCFQDREEGVRSIVQAVESAARLSYQPTILYYSIGRGFLSAQDAIHDVDHIAASNWHALATYVGQNVCDHALLVDVGSTTTDIVPIEDRSVATRATTDFDRLAEGSLLYIGCERTPACALVDHLTWRGQRAYVMNELFATIGDARLVLGFANEDANDCSTADGRPRTRAMAESRLARMIGLDRRSFTCEDAQSVAKELLASAQQRLASAINVYQSRFSTFVISGHGQDLLPAACREQSIDLATKLGPEISRCAPAFAVAKLARDNG